MGHKCPKERKAYAIKRTAENYAAAIALKNNPCTDCGFRFPHFVMEWDHVPGRGKKRCSVSTFYGRIKVTAKTFVAELAKCDLVCANCHRTRTYNRRVGTNESL
jgi:predicted HNH restriction endonuclease